MPQKNAILSPENSFFTSSVGDWTGIPVWEPGPFGGLYGMAKMTINSDLDPNSMNLSYPFIKVGNAEYFRILFDFGDFPPSGSLLLKYILTDGIYSFSNEVIASYIDLWQYYNNFHYLPSDWQPLQSSLTFSIRRLGTYPSIVVLKNIYVRYPVPSHVDHLPLMGVH